MLGLGRAFPTEFFPFHADPLFLLSVPLTFGGWLVAYTLFIRLGFKEKTFGVPIIALCGNLGWEFTFSQLFFPQYLGIYLGQCLWLTFDLVIFYTIWKHGVNELTHALTRQWYRPFMVLGVLISVVLCNLYARYLGDPDGYLAGWILAFMQSFMMISMLFGRRSIRGQSVYIGLGIVVGNIFAAVWTATYPVGLGQPPVLAPPVNIGFCLLTVPFNLLYVVLFCRQARKEGVNPWKRFW